MSVIVLVLGVVLLVGVVVDALWTTIMPVGGGPWTSLLARSMWLACKRLPRTARSRLAPLMGGFMLLSVMLSWLLGLGAGWWLFFSSDPGGVVHAQSGLAADAVERAYFVGFTIFTLGIGDFVPVGHARQIAAAVASFSGFFVLTLSITYLIPVLSAATEKRRLAEMILDLGPGPGEMLERHWNGRDFGKLTDRVNASIWPLIHLHAQRHLAYPVLHYFRAQRADRSLAVAVARLDEAWTILAHAVRPEARPPEPELDLGRRAITSLLELLQRDFIRVADRAPPAPPLDRLGEAGIPLEAEEAFRAAVDKLAARRERVHGFVRDAGCEWEDVLRGAHGA